MGINLPLKGMDPALDTQPNPSLFMESSATQRERHDSFKERVKSVDHDHRLSVGHSGLLNLKNTSESVVKSFYSNFIFS
jgi:hypothetical protein